MNAREDVIRHYVDAISAADGDAAVTLTADDAVIELPDGGVLAGEEGVRRFAAKHAEIDGRKQAVALTSVEPHTGNRFVATLPHAGRRLLLPMQSGSGHGPGGTFLDPVKRVRPRANG
jgi:ketosteroid isomerase-like protein